MPCGIGIHFFERDYFSCNVKYVQEACVIVLQRLFDIWDTILALVHTTQNEPETQTQLAVANN